MNSAFRGFLNNVKATASGGGKPKKTSRDYYVQILKAEIQREKLPVPMSEVRFHPIRRWRFDLGWPNEKIAVEVHGAVFAHGRHTRGQGFEEDREKMNEAQLMGWTVLEYSTGQVKEGKPILDLKRVFA